VGLLYGEETEIIMETVTPQLQAFMEEQSQGIDANFVKQTREMGGTLLMDVGPRGGGKTTKGVEEVQKYKEREPEVRRIANVPIENAYYVPNILKFLATKLIAEGGEKPYEFNEDGTIHITRRKSIPPKMFVVVDETAISGLEARGSGLYPLNTYLLALSRKINVDCELITQMMSMVDKRGPWLADFFCYCQAFRRQQYFHYQYYDTEYHKTQSYKIRFDFAQKYLFPKFDTTDIPNYDELAMAFRAQFNITDDDMSLYEDIKEGRAHKSAENVIAEPREKFYLDRKVLRAPMGRYPGDTIIIVEEDGANRRYEVLQRDWLAERGKYRYRLREIPEIASQKAAMDEAGAEPIEEEAEG
jgi:hypothetical protein